MSYFNNYRGITKTTDLNTRVFGKRELRRWRNNWCRQTTKEKTDELVLKVLEYLNEYNAMLRDYSGTEIYSIEFELKNFLPKHESLKLLPESMILIPREYKETNTIIFALTYTTSLLDMDKSQNSIANIFKLFLKF